MMALLLDAFAAALILVGGVIMSIAALGILRLPDVFMRMHAATKAGVVGSGLILLGAGFALDSVPGLLTAMAGVLLLLATTPIASHALGRSAYLSGMPMSDALVSDALVGVHERRFFDITPPIVGGKRPVKPLVKEESTMTSTLLQRQMLPHAITDQTALRNIVCWLAGGPSHREAVQLALDLSQASGARLTGLSALDPKQSLYQGPLPIGGAYWAKWLAESRRTKMREGAASALADFQSLAAENKAEVSTRHEEGDLDSIIIATSGADMLVVPAGVDRFGMKAGYSEEIALTLSQAQIGPVLRVRKRPQTVRRIALIVAGTPNCGRLSHGLLHTGLWPEASIVVIPVGAHREAIQRIAEEQVKQLQLHGRNASLGEPIDLDAERASLRSRFDSFDAAVMGTLSHRIGWFGAIRQDVHEVASDTVPMTLLP